MGDLTDILTTGDAVARALESIERLVPGIIPWSVRYRLGVDRKPERFVDDEFWIAASKHPKAPDLCRETLATIQELDLAERVVGVLWG